MVLHLIRKLLIKKGKKIANEIAHSSPNANTLYAHVFRFTDKFVFDVGDSAYEAVSTWNDARADECDIPMTPVADVHYADFPDSARDTYFVQIKQRVGGAPTTSDPAIGQGVMYWDGAKEVNIFTELESWLKN